jgi:hypothetical protein
MVKLLRHPKVNVAPFLPLLFQAKYYSVRVDKLNLQNILEEYWIFYFTLFGQDNFTNRASTPEVDCPSARR